MNLNQNGGKYFLPLLAGAGFVALVFEVSWFRMLSLLLGSTVTSSTLVLSGFMLGMGAGAWWAGVITLRRPKQLYRLVPLIFGLSAFIGLMIFFLFDRWLPGLYPYQDGIIAVQNADTLVFTVSLTALIVHAFLLGSVLPLIIGIITNQSDHPVRLTGNAYAAETAGSAVGGIIAAFLLIGNLGQKNTLLLAVSISFLLALLSLTGLKKIGRSHDKNQEQPAKLYRKPRGINEQVNSFGRIAVTAALALGFAVTGLQVVWFRIFRIYLTNTSYTFALIAAMVIAGFSIGSFIFARKHKTSLIQAATLTRGLVLAALAILGGLIILVNLPTLIVLPLGANQEQYILRLLVTPAVSALLVIFPVTLISGFLFPLAIAIYRNDYQQLGHSAGWIFMLNSAGSALGPVATAFILLPILGASKAVLFFALTLLLAAGVTSFIKQVNSISKATRISVNSLIIITFALFLLLPSFRFLPPSFGRFNKKILEYHETTEGTFIVGENTSGTGTVLETYVNNSAVIGTSYDAVKVVKMIGHLPFFTGLKCENALVVGFGIGVTTSAIAAHNEVKNIDCVELVEGLKDAAHYYSGINNNVQNDPRLQFHRGDGRHFLLSTHKKFDLISSDPTHPVLGSANLYSREYFELCKLHLTDHGMVSQYLPLHKLTPDNFKGIIQTFFSVFPSATVWLGQYHAVLLGGKNPVKINFESWSEQMAQLPPDPYFYSNPYHMAACLVIDSTQLSQFAGNPDINTDNLSYTEFFRFTAFDSDNLLRNLDFINKNRCPVNRVFSSINNQDMMNQFILGNMLLTDGLYFQLSSNQIAFRQKLTEAMYANPDNQELTFLMRFYFGSR